MSIKYDPILGKLRTNDETTVTPVPVPDASVSAKGIIQLASAAEVLAGSDSTKAVVPSTLKTELDKKVTAVSGKGLSTNDYDDTEKTKVANALTAAGLGINTETGDPAKFLNQKREWVAPAGGGGSGWTPVDASASTKGIVQLATAAEVLNGTDSSKAVVPSTLKTELDKKVTAVTGKGLSTNDYDNTEKAKVGKIELETLAELTGADVSVAPWTQSKWSASGACSLTASGWAASGHQIAYIVITLDAEATLAVSGATVDDDDALSAAGTYACYLVNEDGTVRFKVASFTEAA